MLLSYTINTITIIGMCVLRNSINIICKIHKLNEILNSIYNTFHCILVIILYSKKIVSCNFT